MPEGEKPNKDEGARRQRNPEEYCVLSMDGTLGNVTKLKDNNDISKKAPFVLLKTMLKPSLGYAPIANIDKMVPSDTGLGKEIKRCLVLMFLAWQSRTA